MKTAILNLTSGGMSEGYKKYLQHIIPRMAHHPEISSLIVGLHEKVNLSEYQKDFPFAHWFSMRNSQWPTSGMDDEAREKIKSFDPDVVFIPTARFWGIKGVPTVTMVRNMEPIVYIYNKRFFVERVINWARAREAIRSSRKANRVIAVSKFVKEFMIRKWHIDPGKVAVVYHGATISANGDAQRPANVLESWKGKFLFTSGSIRPARGLEDLLYAMKSLVKFLEMPQLVIAGEVHPRLRAYRRQLEQWIEAHDLSTKVCWAGTLEGREMAWCYKNCQAFVMTSRAEACPNIALEAMGHGCICVSTDNSPMPEIFSDAAIYYPSKDGSALAKILQTVLAWDSREQNEASERARKRAAEFSWDICAEKTVVELAKALE